MKLDFVRWKKFKIGDLFDIKLSKGDIKIDESKMGDIVLISSGKNNNGIVKHIDKEVDGNKITINYAINATRFVPYFIVWLIF